MRDQSDLAAAQRCDFQSAQRRDFQIETHTVSGETRFDESDDIRLWGYLSPTVCELKIGARHHPRRVYHPSDLRMTAPGVAITRAPDEDVTIRSFSLSDRLFEDALGASGGALIDGFSRLQQFTFRSPIIGSVTDQLTRPRRAAGETGRDADALDADPAYIDALLHAVAHELRRISGASVDGPARKAGRLSAAELRRLNAFIDAGVARKLRLRDLAEALSMPLSAFQDAVKRTTGATAYQHLMQRRLLAARRLLASSDDSLAQIAFRTGFTSQSRMTDVFKAKLGATPGHLRRTARTAG